MVQTDGGGGGNISEGSNPQASLIDNKGHPLRGRDGDQLLKDETTLGRGLRSAEGRKGSLDSSDSSSRRPKGQAPTLRREGPA